MKDNTNPIERLKQLLDFSAVSPYSERTAQEITSLGEINVRELFGAVLSAFDTPPQKKREGQELGDDFWLKPIKVVNKNGTPLVNANLYSHLYRGDTKLSDTVFRRGGLSFGYRDGFCELITYDKRADLNHELNTGKKFNRVDEIFDYGRHCIVDQAGNIRLRDENMLSTIRLVRGRIATMDGLVYDLETGNKIALITSGNCTITGMTCMIIEHAYDFECYQNKFKEFKTGIYKIDFATAEVTRLDDVKR